MEKCNVACFEEKKQYCKGHKMNCFLPLPLVYNHFYRLRLELRFIAIVTIAIAGQGDNNLVVMLVGNKTDLDHLRAVPTEKGKELAEREGMYFMETSALDSTNVDDAFESVIAEIYNNISKRIPSAGNQTLTYCQDLHGICQG